MPIPPSAPYDSLATVTQLARTALADYIQGIQPNVNGSVNTNGIAVTWVSGNQFSYLLNGASIVINGIAYQVALVTSATTLTLISSAGVQAGVAYSAVLPTGDIFSDSQAYVLPTVNLAWRKLQKKLADKGHPRLRNEATIFAIPVATSTDPATQQFISWTQFFDCTNFLTAPLLPQDFISPFRLWERPNGMNVEFTEMHPAGDGLKLLNKASKNRYFDWRQDAIYFRGSLLLMDIHLLYAAFLPDIVAAGGGFGATPVPIMRCADALAYYASAEFVAPRGGEAIAATYMTKGDAATDQITNANAKLQQRSSFHRKAWGERGRRLSRTRL